MISEIIRAFMLIFVAEMGDKTQILAMAFATRFPVGKVLVGIGLGAFLNHGLAVALGSYLSQVVPINTVQMIAGAAFVGFALWTLKPDKDEGDEEPRMKFGPIATVSLAFFLGELGDKTQLTAITLAADSAYPLMILAGTVSGMIATGALGIFIGKKLGDRIPEIAIKLLAASVFMFFGLQKLFQTVPKQFLEWYATIPGIVVLSAITGLMVYNLIRLRKLGIQSEFIAKSKKLHEYYRHMEEDLGNICLGKKHCGTCDGNQCVIGHSKEVIKRALTEGNEPEDLQGLKLTGHDKPFTKDEVIDSLVDTLWLIKSVRDEERLMFAHIMRKNLESILLGRSLESFDGFESYINEVAKLDTVISEKINEIYIVKKPPEERILNLGNRINNVYLIEIRDGYALVDTGYQGKLKSFERQLKKKSIDLEKIKYIFLTHAHDDHAGFLNDLLQKTDAKVIMHPAAADRLKTGQNSFEGGCTGLMALIFCRFMSLLGKGEHRYPAVDFPDRYLLADKEKKSEIEKKISAKIIELPGHTEDSIGILLGDSILICGDAAMNGFPGRHHITIWVEDAAVYKETWKRIIALECRMIYPSHGKPFDKAELLRYLHKLDRLHVYPLKKELR